MTPAEPQSNQEIRFFAAFSALAVLLLAARVQILRIAHLEDHYPLLFYQDVLAPALVAWLFRGLFVAFHGERGRRIIEVAGWSLCILGALYTAIATIVFWYIRSPLTYRLIVLSDNARGFQAALTEDLSQGWTAIPADILIVVGLALLLWRITPALVRKEHAAFYSLPGTLLLIAYLIGAHLWVARNVRFTPAVENPEWAFASSISLFRRALRGWCNISQIATLRCRFISHRFFCVSLTCSSTWATGEAPRFSLARRSVRSELQVSDEELPSDAPGPDHDAMERRRKTGSSYLTVLESDQHRAAFTVEGAGRTDLGKIAPGDDLPKSAILP